MPRRKRKKSLVGWTRKNWQQDFKEHDITSRVMHHEIYTKLSDCKEYASVGYTQVKVRITIQEL